MRVLFLYPRTLDLNCSVGGVAEFLCSLTPALASLGIESIIYAGDKTLASLTKPAQVISAATIYGGPFIKPGFFVSRQKLAPVLELCRQTKVDVIHAQGTYTAGFMALQIHKRAGLPYVVTSHSDILTANSRRISRGRVQRRCRHVLKHAAFVTHLTPMMAEVSHQLWDTAEKSKTIGNGIDCRAWEPTLCLAEKKYMLGMGRLERGKGFHILIDMYARLIERGLTASLVIAGTGSEEKNLHSQAQQLGLSLITDAAGLLSIPEKSVVFTGYVRGEAKKRLVAESQFVLFPTQPDLWEEAFGIVQLEAMAAGKPIIASDTKVTRFLQGNGLQTTIVKPDDVDAWANQAALLLGDADVRKKLGNANVRAAAQFDWQPVAKQYQDVYTSCVVNE